MLVCADFGLHDYNQGLAGVDEYATELERIVLALRHRLSEARLIFLNTSVSVCPPSPCSVRGALSTTVYVSYWLDCMFPCTSLTQCGMEHLQPVHNTDPKSPKGREDNPTVIELNTRAKAIMGRHSIRVIDIYTAIIDHCGPVSPPALCRSLSPAIFRYFPLYLQELCEI